jgi:hypothetical protein
MHPLIASLIAARARPGGLLGHPLAHAAAAHMHARAAVGHQHMARVHAHAAQTGAIQNARSYAVPTPAGYAPNNRLTPPVWSAGGNPGGLGGIGNIGRRRR